MYARYVVYYLEPKRFGKTAKFRERDIRIVGNYENQSRAKNARDAHNRQNRPLAKILPRFINETARESIVRWETMKGQ